MWNGPGWGGRVKRREGSWKTRQRVWVLGGNQDWKTRRGREKKIKD